MTKTTYPHPEDDQRIKQLMNELAQVDKKKQELTTELRMLVYKAEQP